MAGKASLTVTSRVEDKASAAIRSQAEEAIRLADAEVKANEKMIASGGKLSDVKKAQITAAQKISLALRQEAAAGLRKFSEMLLNRKF